MNWLKWRGIRRNLIIACVLLGSFGAGFVPSVAVAETVPQMRVRIFETAKAQHPDVWNGCDSACVSARLASAPALRGIAAQTCVTPGGKGALVCVDVADVARLSVVMDYQWGQDFENLFHRAPNQYDWGAHAIPGLERLRYELAVSPVVFGWVDADGRIGHMKIEYSGME